jgi:probable F420-dependent oxidoreductase
VQVGVTVPQVGDVADRDSLLRAAGEAEELGLSSLWVSDHIAFPTAALTAYPYSRTGEFPVSYDAPFLEALVCLGALAATTERLTLGTSVLVLPLRQTLLAAKQFATVAALAPGRLVVGLGAGWLKEEFGLLDARFDGRGDVLNDQIRALRGVWSDPGYEQSARHVSFRGVVMEPRPSVLPEIWIGGTSAPALRRAGRLGDAWHAIGTRDIDELKAKMSTVAGAAAEAGREDGSVRLTARIGGRPGREGEEVLRQRLVALAEIGCEHVVVDPSIDDPANIVPFYRTLARVADEVDT